MIEGVINLAGGTSVINLAGGNNEALILRNRVFRETEKHVLHEANFGINKCYGQRQKSSQNTRVSKRN